MDYHFIKKILLKLALPNLIKIIPLLNDLKYLSYFKLLVKVKVSATWQTAMDPIQYERIFKYLTWQTIPEDCTNSKLRKQFVNFCKPFSTKNNLLYRQDKRKNSLLLRVIRSFEVEPVLYMTHNDPTAAHFSVDVMFNKIRNQYYWPQMYETIRNYVQTCDAC